MKRVYRCLSLALFLVMVAGLTLMAPSTSPAAAQQSQATEVSDWVVARFEYRDQAALDAVASQLDIWEVHRDEQYALAAVSPDQFQRLADLGYRPTVDKVKTGLLSINAALDPRFYYYDNYNYNSNNRYLVDFLTDTNDQYPGLTEVFNAGPTWQNLQWIYPRSILVLRITNEDPSFGSIGDKPAFFLHAEIHAREVATPELAIRYVKYLTTGFGGLGGYGIDADATWLVDHNVAYILVMANPDGRVMNEDDINYYRRKNMDSDDGCGDPDSWGVDLNRNSSFKWGCCGGSSGSPCAETYRGPTRGGEPETQAFQSFFASVMQDQNGPNGDDEIPPAAPDDATGTFLSLHSYQDEILWPWGFGGNAPNGAQLQTIGRKLGYYSGLTPTQFLYTVDGDTYDWTYGKFGIASFLYEVGPTYGSCADFFPAYGCIDGIDGMPRAFWNEMWDSFQYLHKIARTPYMTSYGPDAQSLGVSPASVPQGTTVELTANIADHRYSSDPKTNVAAAEYFVDTPGSDGAGTPMAAGDGSFGGLTENVVAMVDTSTLPVGTHYILVHGKGTNNYWGPFTAVFLQVTEPEPTGTLHVHAMKVTYRQARVGYAISGQVKVLDQDRLPVGGAVVGGIYTLPNGSTQSAQGTTLSNGVALLKLKGPVAGTYELCVTDVVKSGYTYDPDQNRITCRTLVIP
ncbi:MAG TPA: M14 family zinc carboxypeptidase [Anaerolineae bacterium]|nr:M14 family zinc carboxypeptidase [Anaerolineae bacterium]